MPSKGYKHTEDHDKNVKKALIDRAVWGRSANDRFWEKVDKSGDCWVWTGYKSKSGYGQFRPLSRQQGGKLIGSHVFSFAEAFGEFKEGLYVCHHCDNPPCVRPDHLFIGTAVDNAQDMIAKGRQSPPHGYLDSDLVEKVLAMHSAGIPQTEIAESVGKLRQSVWKIIHGVTGTHAGKSFSKSSKGRGLQSSP